MTLRDLHLICPPQMKTYEQKLAIVSVRRTQPLRSEEITILLWDDVQTSHDFYSCIDARSACVSLDVILGALIDFGLT